MLECPHKTVQVSHFMQSAGRVVENDRFGVFHSLNKKGAENLVMTSAVDISRRHGQVIAVGARIKYRQRFQLLPVPPKDFKLVPIGNYDFLFAVAQNISERQT